MSNLDLLLAILATEEMIQRSFSKTARYEELAKHLKELLDIQLERAQVKPRRSVQ